GNMGTFLSYTAFNNTASPGPQGQPAGSYMPAQVGRDNNRPSNEISGGNVGNGNLTRNPDQGITSQPSGSRGLAGPKDSSFS
ncbi:Type IV secretion system protein virB6, partial [Xanthomonas dyei]